MRYQRIIVATGALVGEPGPLPSELVGLTDALLADLSASLQPPPKAYEGQGFVPVPDEPSPAPTTTVVDIPTFMLRFTPQERIAIRASDDPLVRDFMALIDDPRTQRVNLELPGVQQAIGYLAGLATPLIEPARVNAILSPEPL